MKRSSALAALSRDHHQALDAALRLRRADQASVHAAIEHLRAFWEGRGRAHFEIEERLILPAVLESDGEWREAAARVLDEHARIRSAADALTAHGGENVDAARALGQLLNDHVRFEERELFGLLERRLPDDELALLGEAVESAHPSRARRHVCGELRINSTPSFLIGRRGGGLAKADSGALASTIDDLLGR